MKRTLGLALLSIAVLWAAPVRAAAESLLPPLLSTAHSGWLWSNPFPQGNTLKGVAFAGQTGFAVGGEGTVLRSLDGGSSWRSVPSGTTIDLSLVQVVDPATVFVGGGCSLRRSTNAGASFAHVGFDATDRECDSSIHSFWFLSATSGFVETENDSLAWTADGGASFEARTPVPLYGAKPGPIEFLSPAVGLGLVSGENVGRIMRTSDGGRSWTIVAEVPHALSGIAFPTPLVGYAAGGDGTLLRSEDGGTTWRPASLALPPGAQARNFLGISCASSEICLMPATGEHSYYSNVIVRTADGGRTGTTVVVPGGAAPVEALSFAQPGDAVAVGAGGRTAVSHDDGASFTNQLWQGVEFDDVFQKPRVRLGASPLEAYIAAERGQIAITSDGGHAWRMLTLPVRRPVVDVAFPNSRKGFALIYGGAVYRTDDGGRSWKRCGREGHAVSSLLAPSARVVVIATGYGLWRSTNACTSFAKLKGTLALGGHRRPLSSFDFYAGGAYVTHGHAMFVFGNQVLESTDEGASWQLVPRPSAHLDLADVSFLSANVGYELLQGRIYFTRDRGRSWREILSLPSNELAEPPAMSFSSIRDGYVATRYASEEAGNIIFRTEDAGRTWTPEQLPNSIGGVTAAGNLAYAAREGGGEMFVTTNGGLAGTPSRLTLAIAGPAATSVRTLTRAHNRVTVHGALSPAVADAQIHVSYLGAEGGWASETVVTNARGAFKLTVGEVSSTTWFVAHWNGDDANRGAGTAPVRLTVRR